MEEKTEVVLGRWLALVLGGIGVQGLGAGVFRMAVISLNCFFIKT